MVKKINSRFENNAMDNETVKQKHKKMSHKMESRLSAKENKQLRKNMVLLT